MWASMSAKRVLTQRRGAFDRVLSPVLSLYAANQAIPAKSILLFGRVGCRRGRAQASHSPLWNSGPLVRCLNSAYRDCHSSSPAIIRPSSAVLSKPLSALSIPHSRSLYVPPAHTCLESLAVLGSGVRAPSAPPFSYAGLRGDP